MANAKILEKKSLVVDEIKGKFENAKSVVVFDPRGLNVAEVTKEFKGVFDSKVFIFIKIFDDITGWDIDNKYIKPISDALISSGVIKDDNISKMYYAVKGEYSTTPHAEIYVIDSSKIDNFIENSIL